MKDRKKLKLVMFFTLISSLLITYVVVSFIGSLLSLPLTWKLTLFAFFVLLQWFMAPSVVKGSLRFRYLEKDELPWLDSLVEGLSKKAGVRKPRIALLSSDEPNAFVYGRTPGSSNLVLHTGLIESLSSEELKAVVAHELGHIKRYDCSIMTLASMGPIILQNLSHSFFHSAEESLDGKATSAVFAAIFYLIAIVFQLAYFLTNLFLLWLSRLREYLADEFSAELTKAHDMETALAKITYGLALEEDMVNPLRVFCIEDQVFARKEIYRVLEDKEKYDLDGNGVLDKHEMEAALTKEYDLNQDGRLDGHELQLAMKKQARGVFHRIDEMMSTHPPTYRRIEELGRSGKA